MVPTNTLPYDICPLNLEYVISKNKEIALTSNMMLLTFLGVVFLITYNCNRRETYLLKLLGQYKELLVSINKRHEIFDFENQSIYDPNSLIEYINSIEEYGSDTESETESEAESESDCESGENRSKQPEQNNRRILRSHTKHQSPTPNEVFYHFDRDYNNVRNRKTKTHSNLGIRGKTWRLE